MKVLKQRICRAFAWAALALAALPASAGGYGNPGGVIYDNGAPNHQNGNNMGYAWQAEDFTLGAATSLTDFTFWSLEAAGAYRGSISWQILADNGGMPSSLILASGASSSVAHSLLGSYSGLDEYSNGLSLGSLSLAAGTYWLVLHNGSLDNLGDPNEFYWETAGANATLGGMESFDRGMTWTGNFSEHAFQISAVPEPDMALMLSGGLLLLGMAYRRGRKGESAMKTRYMIPAVAAVLLAGAAHAAQPLKSNTRLQAADRSAPLSEIAKSLTSQRAAAVHTVIPRHLVTPRMKSRAPVATLRGEAPASALQTGGAVTPNVFANTLINQDGIASDNTVAPPDPNGAVGETQYVQWVNNRFSIYRKSDGALLLGPLPGNAVFAGMSGSPGAEACANSNYGDPIVQYDKLAKRWILTQFGWDPANFYTGPYYQCIAVSTSSDATGSYYRYSWDQRDANGQPVFPDYPKLGVWPDAFYFTWALFPPFGQDGYFGPRACGVDRAAMLAGGAATARCYDFGDAYGPVLPSDLDGTTPPPGGSPNYLMSLDYNVDGTGDHLFMWRFSFANASVSDAITIPVAPFTIACPTTYGGPCIQQPAPGEPLDSLGDRLMYRLAYRNFGDREALVANHSVQQPGVAADGPVGVRWYELRNLRTNPGVYQQGTWAPDRNSRWMGSIAMDRMGNIALGYSVSEPDTFPKVRYSGRLRSEPLGRLEPENVIVKGSGVQVDTFNRWGDYSAMTIDPTGDCRFWYTQEYIAETGSFNWRTRIASLNFRNCN